MQGTTSLNYITSRKDITNSMFFTVNHCYRYDIPSEYNQKLGHIYKVLLFDENNNLYIIGRIYNFQLLN
mgnify:CR=1 FL=1